MTSCLPALPAQPRVPQLPALPVQPHKAHQLPASPALTLLLPANNEVEDGGDFLVVLIFFVRKKATQFPESLFLVGAEGVEPPTLASQRLSSYPQSLRDSPEGHADAVFDVIGHLRPPFSMKTPSSDARLMPLGSRGSGVRGRVYKKSDPVS